MVRLARMLVMVVLASTVAACDGGAPPAPRASTPAATMSPSAAAGEFPVPPLRLPTVAPGAPCPVTEPHRWSNPDQAGRVLGPGPLYPVADYFPDGALRLRDEDRQPDGTYVKKVRWIGSGYTGPVLVRAGRIDGPGTATAQFSYTGESRDDGHHAVLTDPASDLPGTTTVGGPGCYAYQVDGTSFSLNIVFQAIPEATATPSTR
ncbi:hypothetical protein C1I95_13030 [Micromonospora craterilacus]|uniref:Uncharacterized protein n=1 Tax=Micromonospora craterilacus TaxID=1655439 RepID=A0A2W2E812_9ACTN|nr:hypothetical protein [Micromonospora craterilacus]PZG18693.1 hypothetical protein C1I95_13030 [Micromonospora craterilacus]